MHSQDGLEKMVDALRQALRGAEEQNTRMQDPLPGGNDETNWGQIGKTPKKNICLRDVESGW